MKVFISIFILIEICSSLSIAQNANYKPCSSPEANQFDFWVGEWDLIWQDKDGNSKTGTNFITKILNGCVIEENFTGDNFIGHSVSVYNYNKKQWQQTWVDNSGGYLEFTGGFEDNKMILFREFVNKKGKNIK